MQIKLLKDTKLEDGEHKAGEVVDVIAEIAKQLLATDAAEMPVLKADILDVIEEIEELPVIVPIHKKGRKHAG